MAIRIHSTAEVSPNATLGEGVSVWHQAQIRERAVIGDNCILGKGAYVDIGVRIGKNCKIQNRASIYHGVTVEDGVFVGPHVCLTNDLEPRAVNPDGTIKSDADWVETQTLVREGAAIGASSVVVAGVTLGRWSMIGAGSVVTRDVPDHGLAYGNPARVRGYVCFCGKKMTADAKTPSHFSCKCGRTFELPALAAD